MALMSSTDSHTLHTSHSNSSAIVQPKTIPHSTGHQSHTSISRVPSHASAETKAPKSAPITKDQINLSALNLTAHKPRKTITKLNSSPPPAPSVPGNSITVSAKPRTQFFGLAALSRTKVDDPAAAASKKEKENKSLPSPPTTSDLSSAAPIRSSSQTPSSEHTSPRLPPSTPKSQNATFEAFNGGFAAHPLPKDRPCPEPAAKASHSSSETVVDSITPVKSGSNYNKMHQTSSRLLRMTDDERPFTRDFSDLFATLVVSLPLAPHRIRLTRIEHSFISEEAINNLGSLKFSQSNRMPDPKDPSRIVTTTTTTTFSMAREMARSVCQRFLEARLIESADGKQAREFTMRGSVWQLTPKGIHILDRFCSRNGIQQKHVSDLLCSPRNTMQLVMLERDTISDKVSHDRGTLDVIFRRFIGINGPNIKQNAVLADSDSLSEYKDGLLGVKMAQERKIGSPPRTVFQTFTGKAACDWLMDCCTVVDRRETIEIAALFLQHDLLWCVTSDKAHVQLYPQDAKFQPTKNAIYQMTQRGKDAVTMVGRGSNGDDMTQARPGVSRDSNTQKLDKILNDPALRLLFRENLRDTHCEENLSFYLDVDEFLRACKQAIRSVGAARALPVVAGKANSAGMDAIKETMASAYGIYNAFLAPGSPCELNIDHLLRNQLATRMTKSVGQDNAMVESLKEVTRLFEEAQVSVFKLMASDSVPKFIKNSKYESTLRHYDFDSMPMQIGGGSGMNVITAPERAASKLEQ